MTEIKKDNEIKLSVTVWQSIVILVMFIITIFIVITYVYPYKYITTADGVIAINKYTREAVLYDFANIRNVYKVKPIEYKEGKGKQEDIYYGNR